jgi:hypothetical protein
MAKKQFYIQTIKPVEEVEVKTEGSVEQPITVGFKVHGLKARKELAEKYEGNRADYIKLMTEVQKLEAVAKQAEAKGEALQEEEAAQMQKLVEDVYKEIDKLEAVSLELTKTDILYFKNVTAVDYDDLGNQVGTIVVANTAKAEPSDYWDTPEECLQGFIEQFCDNKAWLDAIKAAHTEVMQKDFKELQVKN